MDRSLRRILLVLSISLLCFYLFINVILNLPPVRAGINSYLSNSFQRKVDVGFIYLNWKLNPTLYTVRLDDKSDASDDFVAIQINNLGFKLNWYKLTEILNFSYPDRVFRRVEADHLDFRSNIETLFPDSTPDSKIKLPDFPIRISNWTVIVQHEGKNSFRIRGKDLHYDGPGQVLSTVTTRIAGEESELKISIDPKRNFRSEVKVKELSIPDRYWSLKEDRWQGKVNIHKSDRKNADRILTAQLRGTPGLLREQSLPALSMQTKITLSDTAVNLEQFSVESDYVTSDWNGLINTNRNEFDIKGDFSFRSEKILGKIPPQKITERLSIVKSSPLEGNFTLKGPVESPELRGRVQLNNAVAELSLEQEKYQINFKNWLGHIDERKISIKNGILKGKNFDFSFRKGFINSSKGNIVTSFTGQLDKLGWRNFVSFNDPTGLDFDELQNIQLPINFSLIMGPKSMETAIGIKGGNIDFEKFNFADIRLLSSFSTDDTDNLELTGQFKGPDSNLFKFSGNLLDQVRVESDLKRVDEWLQVFGNPKNTETIPSIRYKGVDLKGDFSPLNGGSEPYKIRIKSGAGQTRIGDRVGQFDDLTSLVEIQDEKMKVKEYNVQGDTGEYQLTGEVNLNPTKKNGINVEFQSKNYDFGEIIQQQYGLESEINFPLQSRVDITGNLRNPQFQGQIRNGKFGYKNLRIRDLHFHLNQRDNMMKVSGIEANLRNGEVRGNATFDRTNNYLTTDMRLKGMKFDDFFAKSKLVQQNINGNFDADIQLKGPVDEMNDVNGELVISGTDVRLRRFPRIPGIKKVATEGFLSKNIDIEPFEHTFSVKNGKLNLNNFIIRSRNIELSSKGMIGAQGNFDVSLNLTLQGSALKNFLQDVLGDIYREVGLSDQTRKLTIPIELKGTYQNPEFKVDQKEINDEFRSKLIIENLLPKQVGKPLNELLQEIPFFN